jgi:hypothetical protein
MRDSCKLKAAVGRKRVDTAKAPAWWVSRSEETETFLRSLPGVEVFEIGRSAGGRPIIAAAWGEREDLPNRTCRSLASALSGGKASAFYGEGQRQRQGILFLGNAHGIEFEGSVAALNVLNVIARGKDLRGRRWPIIQEFGRKLRIVVIPHFNIDGRVRHDCHRHFLNLNIEDLRRISQGDLKNGDKLVWPKSKLVWPIAPDSVDVMGGYFNDAGVNLVYDSGLGAEPQPETSALVRFLRQEMPDGVILSHTNNGSLVCEHASFIPDHFRMWLQAFSAVAGSACRYKGYRKYAVAQAGHGYAGQIFYQGDLIYHTCGALPLLVEFPCGYQNNPDTLDELLDISMTTIQEIIRFGAEYRFRPREKGRE